MSPLGQQGHQAQPVNPAPLGLEANPAQLARQAQPEGSTARPAFTPGYLVINHPGGQVTTFTCLEDE